MSDKKKLQLGMNPSTAAARLMRDTLWRLIVVNNYNSCHRCDKEMTRETFSIEHIEPWLDSENPISLYFDQANISFSHLSCNIKDSRNGPKIRYGCGTHQSYARGCRCIECKDAKSKFNGERYCPDIRRKKYEDKGC